MKNNQKESEKKFQDWLESIAFVDEEGAVLPATNINVEETRE